MEASSVDGEPVATRQSDGADHLTADWLPAQGTPSEKRRRRPMMLFNTEGQVSGRKIRRRRAEKGKLLHAHRKAQGDRCVYCERPFLYRHDKLAPTLDHIVPKSKGGRDLLENTAAACRECNEKKGDKSVDEFIRSGFPGTRKAAYEREQLYLGTGSERAPGLGQCNNPASLAD